MYVYVQSYVPLIMTKTCNIYKSEKLSWTSNYEQFVNHAQQCISLVSETNKRKQNSSLSKTDIVRETMQRERVSKHKQPRRMMIDRYLPNSYRLYIHLTRDTETVSSRRGQCHVYSLFFYFRFGRYFSDMFI